MARGISFDCQNWSGRTDYGSKSGPEGPILAKFSAKMGPARPILRGIDFGVTARFSVELSAIVTVCISECTNCTLHVKNPIYGLTLRIK